MGHWIEEPSMGTWEVKSVLFGFMKLNNAHNEKWLGGTLFKIVEWLSITNKINSNIMPQTVFLTYLYRLAS